VYYRAEDNAALKEIGGPNCIVEIDTPVYFIDKFDPENPQAVRRREWSVAFTETQTNLSY